MDSEHWWWEAFASALVRLCSDRIKRKLTGKGRHPCQGNFANNPLESTEAADGRAEAEPQPPCLELVAEGQSSSRRRCEVRPGGGLSAFYRVPTRYQGLWKGHRDPNQSRLFSYPLGVFHALRSGKRHHCEANHDLCIFVSSWLVAWNIFHFSIYRE